VGLKPNGKRCGNTRTFPTPAGRLCRWHLPRDHAEPPVQRIKSDNDAQRLAAWAAVQAARHKLDGKAATAVSSLLKEWRQSRNVNVSNSYNRARDLLIHALLAQFKELNVVPSRAVRSAYQKWVKLYATLTGQIMPEEIGALDPVEDDEDYD
jgi:hypothetical protein